MIGTQPSLRLSPESRGFIIQQTGKQDNGFEQWIPAFAGMTATRHRVRGYDFRLDTYQALLSYFARCVNAGV